MIPATLNLTITRGITFSVLIGCMTGQEETLTACETTQDSTTVSCADTSLLAVGMWITGTGIPGGAKVASITNATHFEMTEDATADGEGLTLTALVPKDISGWTPYASVRATKAGAVQFSLPFEVSDGPTGELTADMTDAGTLALAEGTYYWDLVLADTGGARVARPAKGTLTVETPITRDE